MNPLRRLAVVMVIAAGLALCWFAFKQPSCAEHIAAYERAPSYLPPDAAAARRYRECKAER
jgi:hypothetical protein